MPYLIAKDADTFVAALKKARKEGPVLASFSAPWCHFCEGMIPHFKKLGAIDTVTVLSINHEAHGAKLDKELKLKIEGYPYLLAWPAKAKEPTEIDGAVELEELVEALELEEAA